MIDTKALRSRVLDLAIQGKLTEQLESDGEAFDNNGRIQLESKDYPFQIPDTWKWSTISMVISKDIGGGTPSKTVKEYWENGTIPWMSVKDFSSAQNGILVDTKDHITELGLKNSTSNLIDTDAIIICVRMGLGRIVKLRHPTAINQDLRAIWLSDCIDKDYFIYFYSTLRVEGHGMTVSGIKRNELMNFQIPVPPLAEQKRIVSRVEEIFRLLDTIDAAQAQYAADAESLKAKLITAGIQGRLTEQLPEDGTAEELYQQIQEEKQRLIKEGKIKKEKPLPEIKPEEVPFEIPGNWKWVRLGLISSKITDGEHKTPRRVSNFRGYYLLSARNVTNDSINLDNVDYVDEEEYNIISKRCNPKRNDVLISCSGSIGRCCVVEDDNKYVMVRSAAMISLIKVHPKWIMHCIHSNALQKQISNKAKATAQANLFQEPIKSLVIPLPPLAEQKRIVEKLDAVLKVLS